MKMALSGHYKIISFHSLTRITSRLSTLKGRDPSGVALKLQGGEVLGQGLKKGFGSFNWLDHAELG